MKTTILNYLNNNISYENWGVICLDDFCSENCLNMDDVCNELSQMKEIISFTYFTESFYHQAFTMLDFEIL